MIMLHMQHSCIHTQQCVHEYTKLMKVYKDEYASVDVPSSAKFTYQMFPCSLIVDIYMCLCIYMYVHEHLFGHLHYDQVCQSYFHSVNFHLSPIS